MHDRDIFLSFKYVLFFDKFNVISHEVFFVFLSNTEIELACILPE